MNRPGGEVPQHEGNIPTTILKLCVRPHDVQPIWEVCFVIGVGCLHHDVQSVPNHHRPLSTAMSDDGLKTRYHTLVSQQDFLV